MKKRMLVWCLLATAVMAIGLRATAQQVRSELAPVNDFRSPENTWLVGERPDAIIAGARPDYTRVEQTPVVIPARGRVQMIGGAGGNIAVQVGDEGVVLVDTGVAEAAAAVTAAYRGLSARPLRWIINTSDDLDHTGGNEGVGKGGVGAPSAVRGPAAAAPPGTDGAAIVQFQTVLDRMSRDIGGRPARPLAAWATSTFFTRQKTLYYNGEPIEILHQPAAHSDGDVMVFFRGSDVIAAGDVFNTDRYPYVDLARGGSIQGTLDALNRIIEIAVAEFNMQGGTRVIPGHGRLANEADVVEVRDMATIIRDRVKTMIDAGMTLAQVKAARPTLDYDGTYGAAAGPWTTDMFLEALYRDLSARKGAQQP